MEQSAIAIEKTIDLLEGCGVFNDLNPLQVTEILNALNQIAISGYNDARNSFKV
jgi:hypothetical protein